MKLFPLATILIFTSLLSAKAQQLTAKVDTLFFDDFGGQQLDRSKWNVEVTGNTVNDEQEAYVDSISTLFFVKGIAAEGARNGALVIRPVYHPGYISNKNKKYDFLSGRINTENKVEFTYGTASARMKLPAGDGLWPAFWLLGQGEWPACGEIDIMENIGYRNWFSNAMHGPGYFGNTPLVHRETFPSRADVTQWHVYSVDWTPDSIIFKLDGNAIYTVTRAMVEHYGKWAFDNPKFVILNFALGGGYPHGDNKIEKPYFGMSQETVDQIKAGQAKTLVDWVLVTKPAK